MKKNQFFKTSKPALGLFFLFSFFTQQAVAEIKFEVKGLEKELEKNVNVYLASIAGSELKRNFRFQSRVKGKISEALQAMGYFHPSITFSGESTSLLGDTILTIDVDAGEPVILSEPDVKLLGDAENDPEFSALLLENVPKKGSVLDQGDYEDLKSSIQRLAISRGYFDGKFILSQLKIAPSLNEASIHLHFDSGKRYNYGAITYHNSQIVLDRLDSLKSFSEGDPYLVSELGHLNQSLAATAWFNSALVEADIKNAKDGIVPINVNLEPAPRNLFETGIGYSTNTGARFKGSWQKPWFNSRGHSLDTDLYVSEVLQTLETSYKIPLQDVENEYYKVQMGLSNLDLNDTKSLELTASISRHWLYDTGWQRVLFLRWLYSDFTQADFSETSNLHLPGVSFSRIRTRGGVVPYWGDKQTITYEMASKLWLSDVNLYRVFGETSWIRSTDKENTHRFLTRVKAGMDVTDDVELIPPSLRFFTGGDNSVRGYDYESISPKDSAGELIGGKYMIAASFEYNYQFIDNWWVALFSDIGDTWTDLSPEWRTSAGIGIRWKSPVGPIRFDIAHGFQNESDKVLFHFSLGPEL